jgi:tetratricopeptide repeat protein
VTATDRERIQGLLAEGWRLLEAGQPREAALVFGRVVLVEPTRAEALRGLASARAGVTESERRSDERLDEARRALENGDRAAAQAALEEVIAEGGDRDRAAVLLDRLDPREGRLHARANADAPKDLVALAPAPTSSWTRHLFAAACTTGLTVLGLGVFASWDRLLFGLTRPPAPRSDATAAPMAPTSGERALAQARRLMEAGNPAAAVAALDRVGPQEPAYPFARQLRHQAVRALQGERPAARSAGEAR